MFSRVAENPEWRKELENNYLSEHFKRSAATKTYLDAEHAEMKALLAALGMVKQ